MIKNYTTEITNVKFGTTQIEKVAVGSNTVWENNKVLYVNNGNYGNNMTVPLSGLTVDNLFVLNLSSVSSSDDVTAVGMDYHIGSSWYCTSSLSGTTANAYLHCNSSHDYSDGESSNGSARLAIVSKPSKLTYMGSGTSFSLSNIGITSGWSNYSADNFLIKCDHSQEQCGNVSVTPGGSKSVDITVQLIKSYNSSTGVLTCYLYANWMSESRKTQAYSVSVYFSNKAPK